MPLYEYICEKCDKVFEALGSMQKSEEPTACPKCGGSADRIMPTTFASMAHKGGWNRRVPFHHHPVRGDTPKTAIAKVKGPTGSKAKASGKRKQKSGGQKK